MAVLHPRGRTPASWVDNLSLGVPLDRAKWKVWTGTYLPGGHVGLALDRLVLQDLAGERIQLKLAF